MLDVDLLDDDDPFEIDSQRAHLFKHPGLGVDDVREAWAAGPLFYPARSPAHWLMVADVENRVIVIPLAPAESGDPSRCRPIGCYDAPAHLVTRFRKDR